MASPSIPVNKPVERIALVAMGTSHVDFTIWQTQLLANGKELWDQIWTINYLAQVLRCDLAICMDDLRVANSEETGRPLATWARTADVPILTPNVYPEFPTSVAYPLEEIVRHFDACYFNNSVPYAIAYANWIGCKELVLFGCDYHYDEVTDRIPIEAGRACTEYWLGRTRERGTVHRFAHHTSLFDVNRDPAMKTYGYPRGSVRMEKDSDGKLFIKRASDETETDHPDTGGS